MDREKITLTGAQETMLATLYGKALDSRSLACGLDTRVHRLDPPSLVCWLDVDYPEVLELRERLLPAPPGDYRMIGASAAQRRHAGPGQAARLGPGGHVGNGLHPRLP